MKPYLFNTLLGILAFIVLILPFRGKVYDGRHGKRNWFKGFTCRGWIVCAAFILSIVVNYFKDLQSDKIESDKTLKAKIEKRQDDSISRKRNDESSARIVNTFTSALAKYGLKYDSSERVIQRLVDSSKKQVKIINKNNPEFNILHILLKDYKDNVAHFNVNLSCKQATGYHVNLSNYIVIKKSDAINYEFSRDQSPGFFYDVQLAGDKEYSYDFEIDNVPNLERCWFLFKGTYENLNGQKFNYEKLFYVDIKTKEWGVPFHPFDLDILNFMKRQGVKI